MGETWAARRMMHHAARLGPAAGRGPGRDAHDPGTLDFLRLTASTARLGRRLRR